MITETIPHADALLHFLNAISRSCLLFKIGSGFIVGIGILLFLVMIVRALNKRSPGGIIALSINLPAIMGMFVSGYQLSISIPGLMIRSEDFQIETPQLYFDIFASAFPLFLGGFTSLLLYIGYGMLLAFLSLVPSEGLEPRSK